MQSVLDDRSKRVLESMYDNVHQDDVVDDEAIKSLLSCELIRTRIDYINAASDHYSDYYITAAGRAYVECWREHRKEIHDAQEEARLSEFTSVVSLIISAAALILQIIHLGF